jgi:hypothetical protein
MYSTYHFDSATDIDSDILEAIKLTFKSNPITLTIVEDRDDTSYLLDNPLNRAALLQSIDQDRQGMTIAYKEPVE